MFKILLNIFISLLVCAFLLPVFAENTPVQVHRKIKQSKQIKKQIEQPKQVVNTQPPQDNISIIKARGESYAKHRLSIPKSREHEINDSDFCDISNELKQYGATNIRIYLLNMQYKENGKPIINGRNFKDARYCIKITFKYQNKPYVTGWCRK